jgi:hypothetical protein
VKDRIAWLGRHATPLAWATVALLLGTALGWWAESFTACARGGSCAARVDAIEAVGTWVAGLGTVAAVLYAAMAFRSEEQSRRDMELRLIASQKDQEHLDRCEAMQVAITGQIGSWAEAMVTEFRLHVYNGANRASIFKLRGNCPTFGPLVGAHELKPGGTVTTSIRMGPGTSSQPIGIPIGERDEYVAQRVAETTIMFEMRGHQWQRTGTGPVEKAND